MSFACANTIFYSWIEAKYSDGYGSCSDSNFTAHLLSLEYRRQEVVFSPLFFCPLDLFLFQSPLTDASIMATKRASVIPDQIRDQR